MSKNPYDVLGSVNRVIDSQGNLNVYVGTGNGHSHTVFAPDGTLLFDRGVTPSGGKQIFTGNPPDAIFPPTNPWNK